MKEAYENMELLSCIQQNVNRWNASGDTKVLALLVLHAGLVVRSFVALYVKGTVPQKTVIILQKNGPNMSTLHVSRGKKHEDNYWPSFR